MKILLIDDSTLSRNLLKRSLGDTHQFLDAGDGMRGLELFMIENPDLVFLDLTMPGANGLEILQQLRQINPAAKVIIGTADIQDFTRMRADELGASGYVTKPFNADDVKKIVQQVMTGGENDSL